MDLYSLALTGSFVAAGVWIAGVVAAVGSAGGPAGAKITAVARGAGPVALALAVLALAIHLAVGHRPGSASAMGLTEFVVEHPALGTAALLGAMATWWSRRRGRRLDT